MRIDTYRPPDAAREQLQRKPPKRKRPATRQPPDGVSWRSPTRLGAALAALPSTCYAYVLPWPPAATTGAGVSQATASAGGAPSWMQHSSAPWRHSTYQHTLGCQGASRAGGCSQPTYLLWNAALDGRRGESGHR